MKPKLILFWIVAIPMVPLIIMSVHLEWLVDNFHEQFNRFEKWCKDYD